jgi:hypothetical protein
MNKDYDFLAELEKSIAEKYGKSSVQDFRSQWTPADEEEYLEQIKSCKQKTTSSSRLNTKADRTCPVCKTYSFSGRDDLYMNRFNTCYPCYRDFVSPNPEQWSDGIKPDQKVIDEILRRRTDGYSVRNN